MLFMKNYKTLAHYFESAQKPSMEKTLENVISLEFLKRFFHRLLARLVAVMLNPYFCGKENIAARNARFCNCIPHFFFVEIRLCRVHRAAADFQRIRNAALRLGGRPYQR